MAKKDKPTEPKPWDRRPWPSEGEKNINTLYAEVGLFLSQWERYELVLSFIFASFVAGEDRSGARRAYSAVRTFEGRADMLRAASEAYFEDYPDGALQDDWKETLKLATCYSQRRNDIAHGVVDYFAPENKWQEQVVDRYALYPTRSSFKERSLKGAPSYCMATDEINYFYRNIYMLQRPAVELSNKISRKKNLKSLLRTLYEPAIPLANQSDNQKSPRDT